MVTPQLWARRVFLAVLTLCSSTSAWAQTYSVLKTFEGLISPLSAPIRDAQGNLYELLAGGGTVGQGAIVKSAPDGTISILHNFNGADGGRPAGDLLRDRHGNLYGAASFGGAGNAGTIFKLASDGTFKLLHTFNQNTDGGFPNGGLIRDQFGNLYGTASSGGPGGEGTVFKLAPDGTYTVLHGFALDTNGFLPSCCLVRDPQGNLYGTTSSGGSGGGPFGGGTIFKLAPDGTHTILYSFTGGSDGGAPFGLLRVPGGDLVGVTQSGGSAFSQGTIFRLSTSGTFTVLYTFASYARAGLTRDLNGNLYGVSPQGGSGNGSVFKLAPDGTFSTLYSFAGGDDGSFPDTRLSLDAAGNLYGTTLQGGPGGYGTLFSLAPDGTKTLIHGFSSVNPNGLALDSRGSLFGTTQRGGGGNGSVFELAPVGGTYNVLHSFDPAPDGAFPFASPILDGSDNLYGTTMIGGPTGGGTAFKLAANGTYTVLHGFGGFSFPPDGRSPVARLVSDGSGNLYGTAPEGGAKFVGGIVFKLTPGGAYSVLHSFGPPGDGLQPMAGLVIDASGTLYGTTLQGGVAGAGIVFKLAPDGTYTILHSFAGADGTNPLGGLAQDSSGNLYGTTSFGGASNFGTVFKIAPNGTYTVLHNFALADGVSPKADLIIDSSSTLYGTTSAGGGSNLGTVFKLASDGTYSVLHSFSGADGALPTAGLVLSGSGVLYGTTNTGGPLAGGVVFQIAP